MQFKLFSVSVADHDQHIEELNKFLRTHKILEVENQLVHNEKGTYWCFCIKYIEGSIEMSTPRNLKYPEKTDYRTVLDEATFKKFSILREIRKKIAQEEGLPAFAIFTDEELSQIAKLEILTVDKMAAIKGIGEKKIERFGKRFTQDFIQQNETKK